MKNNFRVTFLSLTLVFLFEESGAVTATFTASDVEYPAADRGFYVNPTDNEMNVPTLNSFEATWGNRLFIYYIDLSPNKGQALPQSFLDVLGTRLAALHGAGAKAILRPRYSSSSSCDDAPLIIVQQHLKQLKPVLAANVDVLAYFQAGILGRLG